MIRPRTFPSLATLLVAGVALASVAAAAPAPAYLRMPDLHGSQVVFVAEADLWLASDRGGPARRLTTHPGTESFPTFSPDGAWIAFTGEYDGNRDVYLLPVAGGEPRRLTWHPAPDEVMGWLPDGSAILFRSPRESPTEMQELYSVPPGGGEQQKLPLGWASRLAVDPASGLWAFNRSSNEFRSWKRYRGGTSQDLWVGDPARADFRRVSQGDVLDGFPMWHGGRLWFLSDEGGTGNLWSMRADGSDRRRHTDLGAWDARWPAMGSDGRIVFMLAGDIALFDPADGSVRALPIELPSDRALTRTRYPEPGKSVTEFELSPDGKRLAVVVRGEIFSVPVKEGVTLPVTRGSGARESRVAFDAEGERLYFVSDATREEEIRRADAWGRGEQTVVKPAGERGWHFPPAPSPDGKWLAWGDQTQSLFVMPATGGAPTLVAHSEMGEIRDYRWSPDGRWLAYAMLLANGYSSVFIHDTRDGRSTAVTGPATHDYSPAWDPDGRYLYFLSDRFTNPILDTRDWNNIEARNTKIYLVTLRPDVDDPLVSREGLPPAADEKKTNEKKDAKAKDEKAKDAKAKAGDDEKTPPKPVEIELAGLAERLVELPVEPGLYTRLTATAKRLFWLSVPLRGMAEQPGLFDAPEPQNALMSFDLEKKEVESFVDGVGSYTLAPGADKLALDRKPGELFVVGTDAPPGEKLAEGQVKLDGVVVELDPREEWAQIYYESWRNLRDFFWDQGMSGIDWPAVRDQYATLLPRLANRGDLGDLLVELLGELATSHAYAFGGDPGVKVERRGTGLLGADLVREGDAFRVARIYRGDPADNVRSPLTAPGVGVREGDYLLAVDHRPFAADRPAEAAFEGLAGRPVLLRVNSKPVAAGSREVLVTPLPSDAKLRYADWVRRNREHVAEKSGGRIAYVHLPDMWTDGLVAWNTWFYPQLDKEGMIVDVRWNGGGAVSQMLIDRLERTLVSWDRARGGALSTYPARVLNGPFVVLTNEFAGSDGDIFPAAVQLKGLAPVIGMRSWGGVNGIRIDKQTVDGGLVTHPEFAWWDPRNGWNLENRGVIPDLELQNLPQDLARGVDAQLDRGIDEVLKLHAKNPPKKPEFGPSPDKSRKAYREREKS